MRRIIQTKCKNCDDDTGIRHERMTPCDFEVIACRGAGDGCRRVVRGIVAELRLLAGAGDVDGNLGSGSILFEEAIGRLEQEAFPAADHLRDRRLHLRRSGEIEEFRLRCDRCRADECRRPAPCTGRDGSVSTPPSRVKSPSTCDLILSHLRRTSTHSASPARANSIRGCASVPAGW